MSLVKSLSVGDGDMFYIKHNSDNFTIIDCCMPEEDRINIVKELKKESEDKNIIRFISTHPDDDHIMGLADLNNEMRIPNFYCVKNEATKEDETEDFKEYCKLRDDKKAFHLFKGCSRKWMNLSSEERGSAGINVIWPLIDNVHFKESLKNAKKGKSPNNISPILSYSLEDGAKILWMGDLSEDFMEKIAEDIIIGAADILIAPHHGRDRVPSNWLNDINPKIIIIGEAPSKDLNYYDNYNTITQNSAGDITLECATGKIHIYVSNPDYPVDFLKDENLKDTYGNYIGTLNV